MSGGATGALPRHKGVDGVYARSTTIQAQPSYIDDGIAYVRDEVMPALAGHGRLRRPIAVGGPGVRPLHRHQRWETEDAIAHEHGAGSAASRTEPRRSSAATSTVDQWEIGVLHRDHRSRRRCLCAGDVDQDRRTIRSDRAIEFYKTSVLPSLEDLEGFCSASLLIDRSSGRGVSSATFDSRDAMERNREQAKELRNTRTRELGADVARRRRIRTRARPSSGARDGLISVAFDASVYSLLRRGISAAAIHPWRRK